MRFNHQSHAHWSGMLWHLYPKCWIPDGLCLHESLRIYNFYHVVQKISHTQGKIPDGPSPDIVWERLASLTNNWRTWLESCGWQDEEGRFTGFFIIPGCPGNSGRGGIGSRHCLGPMSAVWSSLDSRATHFLCLRDNQQSARGCCKYSSPSRFASLQAQRRYGIARPTVRSSGIGTGYVVSWNGCERYCYLILLRYFNFIHVFSRKFPNRHFPTPVLIFVGKISQTVYQF